MSCAKRPSVHLARDPEGWYLGCCDRCVAPLGCIPYEIIGPWVEYVKIRRGYLEAHRAMKTWAGRIDANTLRSAHFSPNHRF